MYANGGILDDETRAQIAKAMTPAFLEDLPPALAGCRTELLEPIDMTDAVIEELMVEVDGFIRLTGGGWPIEQRQEWLEQATVELSQVPASLVFDSVRLARRTIYQPARFVSWIVEINADKTAKLNAESKALETLTEIAAARGE
jgi:hypothetical protein